MDGSSSLGTLSSFVLSRQATTRKILIDVANDGKSYIYIYLNERQNYCFLAKNMISKEIWTHKVVSNSLAIAY